MLVVAGFVDHPINLKYCTWYNSSHIVLPLQTFLSTKLKERKPWIHQLLMNSTSEDHPRPPTTSKI